MENRVAVGKNLKICNSCNTKASATQTPNVQLQRRRASRVRRHLLRTASSRMSCPPLWVGGSEYGDYEYQYYMPGYGGEMEEDGEQNVAAFKSINVGVCAMKNKVQAPPMQSILGRLRERRYIELITFPEKVILESPVEEWPVCECLVAFYSKGFPLEKAIKYVELRKPLVFNDLQMQYSLMDRREVFRILNANGIETPKYAVVDRVKDKDVKVLVNEADDMLEINGTVFHKPFVEKPLSAEDHNIYIYFPSDFGGGSQRLFRKVKNRSSCYSGESSIRSGNSYIYEEFLATDGTDVKVYTVGPDYAHAEARKSPALDGKVERDENGKEVRYPVILTAKEKLIARAVCLAFKQTVCGFDLLRANGKSYVCDVNGFSFVKNSHKYYDDCAQILLEMITLNLCPQFFPSVPPSVDYLVDEFPDMPVPIPRVGNDLELRCVVGVIRHGDRTPKQKMKMIVKHKRFFDLFQELHGYESGQVKIKKPKLLQRVLDISRVLLGQREEDTGCEIEEKKHKLEQLKSVLEMYGTFSGINRKLQLKLLSNKSPSEAPRLLLILKWGGEQTQSGQNQAEELGRAFRIIYPGGEGEYASLPGSGFLRLHSTYRHDLKVYASDEGRVQMTAAAFTKGLLDLEGNPASVLVHLVKRDQAATNMLDTSTVAQNAMNRVKEHLHDIMRSPGDFDDSSYAELAPTGSKQIGRPMHKVGNPREQCEKVYTLIQTLMKQLKSMLEDQGDCDLNHGETLQLMMNRWSKLEKDFKQEEGIFDISKIPDIYDCIKYDLLHNRGLNLTVGEDLFKCIMPLADIVMPQEYGITVEEKLDIAHKICKPILSKIQADFHHTIINETTDILHRLDHRLSKGVVSPKRHVRTRLYFTSESHVHSLTNLLKHDDLIKVSDEEDGMENIRSVPELNYMTQIVFLLFEDCSQPEDSDLRYCVTIHFSPGVRCRNELLSKPADGSSSPNTPISSPNKPAPIHAVLSGGPKNGTTSQPTTASEDNGELLHIVRRYSEYMPSVPQGKASIKKVVTVPPSSSPVWVSMSGRTNSVKSHSETEITFEDRKRRLGISASYNLPAYHSSHGGIIDSTVPSAVFANSNGGRHSFDVNSRRVSDFGACVEVNRLKDSKVPMEVELKPNVSFTIGSDSKDSENSKGSSPQSDRPGSTENLLSSEPPRSNAMSGLVLATDLVSTISQLTPVASIPLSRVNDYLSTITGISLNYDQPAYKNSPDPNRRTPIRGNRLSSCLSGFSSQPDLEYKQVSESPLKDSMEAIKDPSRQDSLDLSRSDAAVEVFPDSANDLSLTTTSNS